MSWDGNTEFSSNIATNIEGGAAGDLMASAATNVSWSGDFQQLGECWRCDVPWDRLVCVVEWSQHDLRLKHGDVNSWRRYIRLGFKVVVEGCHDDGEQ